MNKIMTAVLALSLIGCVANVPSVKTAPILDLGTITYEEKIETAPQTRRLYDLTSNFLDFVYESCYPAWGEEACRLYPSDLNLQIYILPYKKFEARVLSDFERDPNIPQEIIDALKETGVLVEGHTVPTSISTSMFFYQQPSDELFIHELMHVVFSTISEVEVRKRVLVYMTSQEYKQFLRANYE